uniref:Nudix hydrolase domain-containing protein n=1 Tax=Physcomitrium patens TaxID=3218 RepID=A0A7I4E460_PHYPA
MEWTSVSFFHQHCRRRRCHGAAAGAGGENSLRLLYKRALGITIATSGRMTALVARTGRHQQRYEHGHRLVAGCIPYRYRPTGDGKSMEVLMISSQRGEGLLFPKGGWETDETVEEAACREALEEAGVKGHLQGMLGTWDFKSKRQQGVFCPEGLCRAYMFALDVTEQLETWPEQHARQRQWTRSTSIFILVQE